MWSFWVQMAAELEVCQNYRAIITVFRYDFGEYSCPSYRTLNKLVPIDYNTDDVPLCALEVSDSKIQKILGPRDSKFEDKLYFAISVGITKFKPIMY